MMITEKENTRISKFLSLVLRHQQEAINISIDENGWVLVSDLLQKLREKGFGVSFDILEHVVATNNKKRFAFNDDKTKIRVSQGHSINIDLGHTPTVPPAILYHGTAQRNVTAILKEGLQKRSRQHVHLSTDIETALKVGQRHGKPVVLEVLSGIMSDHGFVFFLSENGVLLTDHVPPAFLRLFDRT